jgi:hypothetical protein
LNLNFTIHDDSGGVNIWEATDLYVKLMRWKCLRRSADIGSFVCSSAEFIEGHMEDASVASFMKALSLIEETTSSFLMLESAFFPAV